MAYTDNVPQANQQIAATQAPILANFTYLKPCINQEHNFDISDPTLTYHLQASMPNKALSPTVPAACNGAYFVSSGAPYFYDKTNNYQLNTWQGVISGTFTSTGSYTNIALLPVNVQGIVVFMNTSLPAGQIGTFLTDASNCYGVSTRIKLNGTSDDFAIELNNSSGSLQLQGRSTPLTTYRLTYTYKIFYRPA